MDDPEHSFENDYANSAKRILWQKGYSISKESLTHNDMIKIRNTLRARPISLPNFPQRPSFKVYQETANWVRLPRVWGVSNFGSPDLTLLNDCNIPTLPWSGSLRPDQMDPYNSTIQHLEKNHTGILSLPTGRGKTFVALAVLAHFNQRCLIVVHTTHLLHQWKKELESLFPMCSIGIVQGAKRSFDPTNDFVICMIQTLLNIPKLESIFGITVVDECHHLSGEVFNTIMFNVQSKYVLGLSATPKRKDGLTYVLNWHLGDIFYTESPKLVGKEGIVQVYHFSSTQPLNLDPGAHAQKITNITQDISRSNKIINTILEFIRNDPQNLRKILVLTERRDHALYIKTQLEKLQTSKDCSLFLGNMKHTPNDDSKDIIVATYALFSEGVSIPHLNTLVFATPKRDIVQSLGRIFRKQHSLDAKAIIIDFVDDAFNHQYAERRKTYRSQLSKVDIVDFGYL